MTTSGDLSVRGYLRRLRANWPALLLPLAVLGALAVFRLLLRGGANQMSGAWPALLVPAAAALMALLAPEASARIAAFAVIAFAACGFYLMHFLRTAVTGQLYYGLVHVQVYSYFLAKASVGSVQRWAVGFQGSVTQVGPGTWLAWWSNGRLGLALAEAVAFLAVGVWLLARTGAPGGGAIRRAVAQLRGTLGQPRTVPPLLLVPTIFLWEELFSEHLWFGRQGGLGFAYWPPALGVLILGAGLAAVRWLPRAAAVLAVGAMMVFGLIGVLWCLHTLSWSGLRLPTDAPATLLYGAVMLDGGVSSLLAGVQGVVLLAAACALLPRLLAWPADAELAERARALARQVDGLTRTRSDATETAVAELRRIERDLHDGAQARLVAVGMSLRAAEQLMPANPEAALALVAEARETSSRAIEDLRDLVRGIYPPVLADRGLADAVRALALDAVLEAEVAVDLTGEPPMPVAAAVYFAVAEALTNAARHAGACAVRVSVDYAGGMLRATVADDGRGGADAAQGTGLAGVERRLATFDGILAVSSPPGGPTIVAIEVPCALSSVKISSC